MLYGLQMQTRLDMIAYKHSTEPRANLIKIDVTVPFLLKFRHIYFETKF